jgi:hypothetical protein
MQSRWVVVAEQTDTRAVAPDPLLVGHLVKQLNGCTRQRIHPYRRHRRQRRHNHRAIAVAATGTNRTAIRAATFAA